jgi:hypothetical protein
MHILCNWRSIPNADPIINADVIIGMSFGANHKSKGENPGVSNEEIARIVYRLWNLKNVPVIVQREVAEALVKLNIPIRPALVVSEIDGQVHIGSHEVMFQAWRYCQRSQITHVMIVAHPAHILRCAWVAQKIGFIVSLPDVSSVPYEPTSTQWWTRNKWYYWVWELHARIWLKINGYL